METLIVTSINPQLVAQEVQRMLEDLCPSIEQLDLGFFTNETVASVKVPKELVCKSFVAVALMSTCPLRTKTFAQSVVA